MNSHTSKYIKIRLEDLVSAWESLTDKEIINELKRLTELAERIVQ